MKFPTDVRFRKDLSLLLWSPRGVLDEAAVNEIVAFIETVESRTEEPINRFHDLSRLDAVDLNFRFVFYVALGRRLSVKDKAPVKSAFYVTSPATTSNPMPPNSHPPMLTDYSPLDVALFTDRAVAAKWLNVPLQAVS